MQLNGRPGDERGFIHGRIIGGIGGFLGGGPVGAIAGFLSGGGNGSAPAFPQITPNTRCASGFADFGGTCVAAPAGFAPNVRCPSGIADAGGSCVGPPLAITAGGGNGMCDPPLVWNGSFCEFPGSPAGGVGEAVMGRYGAALEPGFFTLNKRVCLEGMVLGKDKLCYNKGSISNKERLWPAPTRPLLTGGEMSAIRKASAAARKFQRTGKRFQSLGFLKPPPAARARKRLPAATVVKVLESGPGSVQI